VDGGLRCCRQSGRIPQAQRAPSASSSTAVCFLMPSSEGGLVIFEDFYWHGFGNPCHPFLHKFLEYYKVSLCNQYPKSILSISIFINLCEACLGIQPHFNLWCHFFFLKKKGGSGGSKIAGGAYLLLWDHMKAQYLNVPLNTSMKDWYRKWFSCSRSRNRLRHVTLARSLSTRRASRRDLPAPRWC
jgi:hypothetical protein